MPAPDLSDYLCTWNQPAPAHAAAVLIDDDTLRDGMQGAFARRITPDAARDLLRLTDEVGVSWSIIGFPSDSADELDRCRELIEFAARERLRTLPTLLARTHASDVAPLVRLRERTAAPFMAELFVGTSPLRRHVEGWSFDQICELTRSACAPLVHAGVPVGLSLEDASRTPPDELAALVELGVDAGVARLTLCDTVGDALPEAARRITAATRAVLTRRGVSCALAWHGHNDRGCAVASSIAAVEAGADVVSGTFLGLGERTGNASLEQIIAYLDQAGSRRFRVDLLPRLAARLAEATGQEIPVTAPIVGMQAFATTAGVHAAALLKARPLGAAFEDHIYSSVPASRFGRAQAVLLGPMSGLSNARRAIELYGRVPDDELARRLLAHARGLARWMSPEEIGRYLQEQPAA